MDCRDIREKLPAFMEGELAPAEEDFMRLHLGVCQQCAADLAKLSRGWQALDAWEDRVPPDRLRRKILGSAKPQRQAVSVRALLSVAAALILVIGIAVYYKGQKTRSAQELATKQSTLQTGAYGDISEDEIIANLLILQEHDFFEELDELVRIDDLPFAEEPFKGTGEPDRSALEVIPT